MSPFARPSLALGLVGVALAACSVAPTSPSVSIGPDAPTTLDDLVATATLASTDGEEAPDLVWSWSLLDPRRSADFLDVDEVGGPVVPASLTARGQTWRVEVQAVDGELTSDVATAEITVLNTPPTVTQARLSPASGVDTFGSITASAAGRDIDEDRVDLTTTWYVDGVALDVDAQTLTGEYFEHGQQVWIEVVASDGESDSEPLTSNIVVIDNSPPSIAGARVTPDEIIESTEVSCGFEGWWDPDDDAPDIEVAWLVNGVEVSTADTISGSVFARGDLVRCAATPFDGEARGPTKVSPVVTVGNSPPSIEGVTLDTLGPRAEDALGYTLVGLVDDDGDPITSTAEWYVDGELVASGIDTLPPRSFRKGQEIWAIVTPTDGLSIGEPVMSDVATAANTPPRLTSVTITPGELYTDTAAFPVVVVEDVDGDRLTYTVNWTVNGTSVTSSSVTLEGEDWFDRGDLVQVEVTANDGTVDSATVVSDEIEVLNSAPTTPVVGFDAPKVRDDVDLICRIRKDSVDADDDDLTRTVTWTRNGSPFLGASTTSFAGDTILASDTDDLDDWVCTYTVTDGEAEVFATAAIEVRNWEGPRTFTACGAKGVSGPSQSQCNTAYTSTTLDGFVTVVDGVQEWVAPVSGTYRIEAWGAQGGRNYYGSYSAPLGARMRGDFELAKGDVVRILVGQTGSMDYYVGGGGGGTFVVDEDDAPMVVAGGGGGLAYAYNSHSGCDATTSTSARTPFLYSTSCTTASTSSGQGGSYTEDYYDYGYFWYAEIFGAGGGGFYGNGKDWSSGEAGKSFVSGGQGGRTSMTSGYGYGNGGFGGGSSAMYRYEEEWEGYPYSYTDSWGGGGGGGYTGGDGGYYVGGGGGSYNAGSNPSNSSGVRSGDGQVVIDLVPK